MRLRVLQAGSDADARQKFQNLWDQAQATKVEQKELFERQAEAFKSEIERIIGELNQVKALLAVKMTEGKGFVEGAASLLGAELVARDTFNSRQVRFFSALFRRACLLCCERFRV